MSSELAELSTLVADVAHHVDAKRWAELRALYADVVDVDYTSLFGGTPQRQAADALVSGLSSPGDGVYTAARSDSPARI